MKSTNQIVEKLSFHSNYGPGHKYKMVEYENWPETRALLRSINELSLVLVRITYLFGPSSNPYHLQLVPGLEILNPSLSFQYQIHPDSDIVERLCFGHIGSDWAPHRIVDCHSRHGAMIGEPGENRVDFVDQKRHGGAGRTRHFEK